MTPTKARLVEILQIDIGSTYVYCLCHGWRRPNTADDLCQQVYATSEVEP